MYRELFSVSMLLSSLVFAPRTTVGRIPELITDIKIEAATHILIFAILNKTLNKTVE